MSESKGCTVLERGADSICPFLLPLHGVIFSVPFKKGCMLLEKGVDSVCTSLLLLSECIFSFGVRKGCMVLDKEGNFACSSLLISDDEVIFSFPVDTTEKVFIVGE